MNSSRPHLIREFKHMFSVFKQHYTYFHTFLPTRISKKTENCCLNTRNKRAPSFTVLWHVICLFLSLVILLFINFNQ